MDRKALIDVAQAHGLAEVAQMLASRSWTPSELELLNFAIGAQILLNETRQRALEAVVMAEYDPVRERLLRSRIRCSGSLVELEAILNEALSRSTFGKN